MANGQSGERRSQRGVRREDEPHHGGGIPFGPLRRDEARQQAEPDPSVAIRRVIDEGAIGLRAIGEPPQKRIERHQVHELPVVAGVVDDERSADVRTLLEKRRLRSHLACDVEEAAIVPAVDGQRLKHRRGKERGADRTGRCDRKAPSNGVREGPSRDERRPCAERPRRANQYDEEREGAGRQDQAEGTDVG